MVLGTSFGEARWPLAARFVTTDLDCSAHELRNKVVRNSSRRKAHSLQHTFIPSCMGLARSLFANV